MTHAQPLLEKALDAHRAGRMHEALAVYETVLTHDAEEPLALYGAAQIKIFLGDIGGFPLARKAIFTARASTLDKSLAAESILHALLQQQYQDHAKELLVACEEGGVALQNAKAFYESVQIPGYLEPTRLDQELQRDLERYRPIESAHYVYAIDIVGGCNLRCPTCPVGQKTWLPKGIMPLELFQKILTKIRAESVDANPDIWFFNWTEPMLHPEIEAFIGATHAAGMTSFISSNLNIGHRLEAVMRAAPTRFKISLSSLKQSIYGKTHARGDIGQVVANMRELARWRDHYKSATQIWIGHHLYRNTLSEQEAVKSLADELGFGYAPSPAIVAPIEKVMQMKENPTQGDIEGLRAELLYDPLHIQATMASKRSGRKDCELRFNMTTIQHDGLVNLCCATTQPIGKAPVSFLDHTHRELEDMKYANSFCKKCMDENLHLTIADR